MADVNCKCIELSYVVGKDQPVVEVLTAAGLYGGYNYFVFEVQSTPLYIWLDFDEGMWIVSLELGDSDTSYATYNLPICPVGDWSSVSSPFVSFSTELATCEPLTCGCPEGYRINDFGECENFTSAAPTANGAILNAVATSTNSDYGLYGAYIFENITDLTWPIIQTQVGVTDAVLVRDFYTQDLSINQIIPGSPWNNRLSTTGVWTGLGSNPLSQWIGFTFCIEVTEAKTYFIGFGSTTNIRIKINGQVAYIAEHPATPKYKRWQILPIDLEEGINNILVEGFSTGGTCTFGMEVYEATLVQLQNATSLNIDDYVIVSTETRRGGTFDSGVANNYSCASGFHLENCSGTLRCIQREFSEMNPCCIILTNCQDPSQILSTKSDLTSFIGQVVSVELHEGCWQVSSSELPCEEFQEIVIIESFETCEDCIPSEEVCYTLISCEDEEEILRVKGNLSGYVGQIVKIENFDGCWQVTESTDPCFPVTQVQVTDYFSNCEACLPNDCCKPNPCCNECM